MDGGLVYPPGEPEVVGVSGVVVMYKRPGRRVMVWVLELGPGWRLRVRELTSRFLQLSKSGLLSTL